MPPKLHPIAPELSPLHEGEMVTFRDNHPDYGALFNEKEEIERSPMTGVITAIGIDKNGALAFDLAIRDPFDLSAAGSGRFTLEDIQ